MWISLITGMKKVKNLYPQVHKSKYLYLNVSPVPQVFKTMSSTISPIPLFVNSFSQAIKTGGVFPEPFVATGVDSNTVTIQGGVSMKREPRVPTECNPATIAMSVDANVPEGYQAEEFNKLVELLKVQTLFTREALVFTFSEDSNIVEMNFKFKETTGEFTNKKYVNIVFNKETGFVCKTEILSKRYFNLYVWKISCGEHAMFSRHSLLKLNAKKNKYIENNIHNYYYDSNGFTTLEQFVVFTKGVASVTNTIYNNEPVTPCKNSCRSTLVPLCPGAPPRAARKLEF